MPPPHSGNDVPGEAPPAPRYVANLTQAVKALVRPTWSAGQFAKSGVYASAWHTAVPMLNRAMTASMWTDKQVTWRQVKLAMKARWGHLWNRKLAFRYGMAPSPNCPLCGHRDGCGHLLGSCAHPEAVAMRIARHDEAVRTIQRTFANSSMKGFYTLMDAGTKASLPADVQGKRLPAWLLPHISENERKRLRPDLCVIEGLTRLDTSGTSDEIHARLMLNKTKYVVHIMEVGYCSDIDHASKDTEKAVQHEHLANMLRESGFTVQYHTITLGRTGTIPLSVTNLLKTTLKLNSRSTDKCTKKLSRHAVHWVEKMYVHRQVLERSSPHTGAGQGHVPRQPG